MIYTVLLFIIYVTSVNCVTISGCPSYGCRPSGTFSYLINISSKDPKIIWTTTFEAIPYSLGCVGNINNLICPYRGPKSNGYVSIDSATGNQSWYADVLHNPSLPVMDIEGDIIGTDGHNLVKYMADGTQVKPSKPVSPLLYPLFSPQIADNGILLFASMSGIIFTMDTAGIPHASLCFNGTVERFNGTFLPVTTPIIVGTRAYILTEFRPDDDIPESRQPHVLGLQRLYAIDIYLRLVDRLHIAWIYDFEREDATIDTLRNIIKDKTLRFKAKQQVQGDPLLMADVQKQIIYIILPAPEVYTGAFRLFWAIKDGDDPSLLYKRTIAASRMAMYEINGSGTRHSINLSPNKIRFGWKNLVKKRKKDTKKLNPKGFSGEIPVWLLSESRKLIFKITPLNGSIASTFNLTALMGGNSFITSDIMVYRDADDQMDNIIFGVTVEMQKNQSQNYVVSLSADGQIQWQIKTPSNVVVTGQIAGISSEGANSVDIIVVFGNNQDGTSSVFGIQ